MPDSSMAGVITASASAFTAIALVITAVTGLIRSYKVEGKVDKVHKIVNQERTDRMNYQRALIRALEDKGVTVPVDQSIPVPLETTDR
jgi:hypothetical protein